MKQSRLIFIGYIRFCHIAQNQTTYLNKILTFKYSSDDIADYPVEDNTLRFKKILNYSITALKGSPLYDMVGFIFLKTFSSFLCAKRIEAKLEGETGNE